ncbi:SIS domain-containing protein [Melghirimyces algeriensis]|uniref:Uncharacterized protein, contains SIS (Sugar ISomerase) phosphosugar binding domain n=1 Tax=Melghirimyces algeriensis TaxID=910412 RepID=A0A521BYX2_9BACL|nr:SIS domain-containing protein [Melghirimyces algeriensis]SMO52354.1 Uncharacterized protein, contains SIS (Sugar ISomerase) phosphosugar binding domain [Melghirimyces algeriensis]
MFERYFFEVGKRLRQLEEEQGDQINKAASECARCIKEGGILHLFGSGHSYLIAQEGYYRAGGLAPVRLIVAEDLQLSKGGHRCSIYERQEGYAASFLSDQDIRPGEVLFIFSTSGRNPVSVDVARFGKKQGAFVIGVTAKDYSNLPSRHSSGALLMESVDLVIDNCIPMGDALLSMEETAVPFAPGSTVLGTALWNGILAKTVRLLVEEGIEPPVFRSGNVEGADLYNKKLMERYQDRIRF